MISCLAVVTPSHWAQDDLPDTVLASLLASSAVAKAPVRAIATTAAHRVVQILITSSPLAPGAVGRGLPAADRPSSGARSRGRGVSGVILVTGHQMCTSESAGCEGRSCGIAPCRLARTRIPPTLWRNVHP